MVWPWEPIRSTSPGLSPSSEMSLRAQSAKNSPRTKFMWQTLSTVDVRGSKRENTSSLRAPG